MATQQLLKFIPHIKSVDDLTSRDSWDTVLANKNLRYRTHTSATKLFVSFGFGLKDTLEKGTLQGQSSRQGSGREGTSCHRFAIQKRKYPSNANGKCPSSTRTASVIASAADPSNLHKLIMTCSMTWAERTQFYNAHIDVGTNDMSTTKEGDTRISLVMSESKYR